MYILIDSSFPDKSQPEYKDDGSWREIKFKKFLLECLIFYFLLLLFKRKSGGLRPSGEEIVFTWGRIIITNKVNNTSITLTHGEYRKFKLIERDFCVYLFNPLIFWIIHGIPPFFLICIFKVIIIIFSPLGYVYDLNSPPCLTWEKKKKKFIHKYKNSNLNRITFWWCYWQRRRNYIVCGLNSWILEKKYFSLKIKRKWFIFIRACE